MANATTDTTATPTLAGYYGLCAICGHKGEFQRGEARSIREGYRCPSCHFALRWRDQASLIVDEFGNGQTLCIVDLVNRGCLDGVAIYEPALRGPFVQHFRRLPRYTQSYYWPDRRRGSIGEEGVRNEDLTKLTFPDDSFDLIITSDVMEHLLDIDDAFRELTRVLKPGGVHIFSIPTAFPLPDKTVARVLREGGKEVNVLPAIHHNAGDGTPCLVYHDYGADLPARIDRHGSRTSIVRRSGAVEPCGHNATFVTRKLGAASAEMEKTAAPGGTAAAVAAEVSDAAPAIECPVCGSDRFDEFHGRPYARCSRCRCVERERLLWMMIEQFDLLREGLRVLHIAPQKALSEKFRKALGDTYRPMGSASSKGAADSGGEPGFLAELASLADDSFDVVVHSHVIDAMTDDVAGVLRELKRVLADEGHHLMSEPIGGAVLADGRRRRPHITQLLEETWGGVGYFLDPLVLFDEARLRRHCIPETVWTGRPNSQGVFYNRAPHLRPSRATVEPLAAMPRPSAVPVAAASSERPRARNLTAEPALSVSDLTTDIETGRLTKRRELTAAWILRQLTPAARHPRAVDLGAGHCAFSKLAASLGHAVTAVDGRTVRRPPDLGDITFRHEDVRHTDLAGFDVVMILGLLYHLEPADQMSLLERCPAGSVVIVDTQLFVERLPGLVDLLGDRISTVHPDVLGRYDGVFLRENDTPMASIGNAESFIPSEESLLRMFGDTGFVSVMRVDPIYYTTAGARRWYVAKK